MNRIRNEYGDELFKTESAYRVIREDDDQSSNTIVPESKMKSMKEADSGLKFERAVINNQEAFIVTSVVHLPFAKNDVISESGTGFTARSTPGASRLSKRRRPWKTPAT